MLGGHEFAKKKTFLYPGASSFTNGLF